MNTNPRQIAGNWANGWALDIHTIKSIPLGLDEWGHEVWDIT